MQSGQDSFEIKVIWEVLNQHGTHKTVMQFHVNYIRSGKQISELSRLELFLTFSANNFTLSQAEDKNLQSY